MKNKLIALGVVVASVLASTAGAAVPTEVTTAITAGASDATAVATAGVAVMAVFITWKLIRRAANRLV
jgi:hypothetical protein